MWGRTQQEQDEDDDEHHEGCVAVGHRQPHQARLEDLLPSFRVFFFFGGGEGREGGR